MQETTPHFDAYLALAAELYVAKAAGAPGAVLDEIIEAQFDCWQDMSETDRAEARRRAADDGWQVKALGVTVVNHTDAEVRIKQAVAEDGRRVVKIVIGDDDE